MTNPYDGRHPATERLQDLLDDRLPAEERAEVRRHVDGCPACRAELETWRALFAGLEGLPELAPSEGFAENVLQALPRRRPLWARVGAWVRGLVPGLDSRDRHPGTDRVLAYLDRALPGPGRRTLEAHLEECVACRSEVDAWRALFAQLDGLGRLDAPEGFAEAVMAEVRAGERRARTSPAPAPGWLGGWVAALRPRTSGGWTLIGAAAAAPAVALAGGILALFSHPLLTPSDLGIFLWWQLSGAARTLVGSGVQSLMESPLLFRLWEAARTLAASPEVAGAGALAFAAAMLGALWVFYRNVISTPTPDRGYADASTS